MEVSKRLRIAAILVLCAATGSAALATATQISGSGQIQFAGPNGAPSGDPDLQWDATNKRLGIGTVTPATTLEVKGTVTAERYLYQSDARFKADIAPLADQLGRIAGLEPVAYSYKADPAHARRLGLIAQNVEAQFPEAVHTDAQGLKYVDYPALIAPLIEAVRELKAANEAQAEEIAALRAAMTATNAGGVQ